MAFQIIIPARYQSSRLPGKPLLPIGDRIMLQHVYDQAVQSGAAKVYVATDHAEVASKARLFGASVIMTSEQHLSGTDRLAEACAQLDLSGDTIIVNVQGDEPFLPPALIHQVATLLQEKPKAVMATLYEPMNRFEDVLNPNQVKVVMDQAGYALYFSRSPIPHWRGNMQIYADQKVGDDWQQALAAGVYKRHIGLYAYRAGFLKTYTNLKPEMLENYEHLEQLRMLASGYQIAIDQACCQVPPGVDTQADWQAACDYYCEIKKI